MSKKISVIIPCYNQSNFLEATLHSVICQTHADWECIIIDDGSTDNSKEIALQWCGNDSRFLYHFKTNGGLSSARNAGLRIAKGDFIQLLDADDLIEPTKFEKQLKDLESAQISISNYFSFVDGNLRLEAEHRYLSPFFSEKNYKQEIIIDWEYRKSIPCHSVLFKKEILKNDIFFSEVLKNHEDWVFWVQLFYASNTIINNKEVLAFYRIRSDSMSADYAQMRKGFVDAADVLIDYFKRNNETELYKLSLKKKKEILNKNKNKFLFKRIQKRIIAKITHLYKYVKKN